ncbi:MAG: tRNA (N(6)-L-threonylcarbamoyladenosine(37)-C(2))-methylthiotransferase MtaB [Candidatus Eremiobacteraeota bacterium]|nr:tRNA (N(6)-L-threonylcarbamoyladenosine(37)-C(2))-methylthiotransferase MtaB [Candidatus Eremiobacteraeota bacterium]
MEQRATFSIHTLGCKVNQYESEKIRETLLLAGYCEVPFGAPAQVQIINTCTVTHTADRKSRQKIRSALRAAPGGTVVVTGCAVEHDSPGIKTLDERLVIVPQKDKEKIAFTLTPPAITSPEVHHSPRTRAMLKIGDGCDHFCSYCIVPHVRGRIRSRLPDEVEEEAEKLAGRGFREIVLTAIHLGAYGRDLPGGESLPGLIDRLARRFPSLRIRLSSIEPQDFSEDLLEVMERHKALCRHIHLPLQHASPSVLERMGRGYTIEEYQRILERITARIPDVALTSDIIVGFPGETEADFTALFNFIDKACFFRIHVFKFSPRPGTPAAHFPGKVREDVKQERSALLIKKGVEHGERFCRRFIGETLEVLAEGSSGGMLHGLAGNYIKVRFRGKKRDLGRIIPVRISNALGSELSGSVT